MAVGRRVRRKGEGRKKTVDTDSALAADLERWVEPVTPGDPESPLRWTCQSVRRLAEELNRRGHSLSHPMVADRLPEMGYSLPAHRKTLEGARRWIATRSWSTSMGRCGSIGRASQR